MTTTQPNNITMSSGQFLFTTANYRIYTKSVYTLMPFTNKISGIKANWNKRMKKILFITGSINQTTQMHQIANELPEFDCWFSQLFTDNTTLNTIINKTTLLSGTVLSTKFRLISEEYLQKHALQIDFRAQKNKYDLVVFCTDLIVPPRMRNIKTIFRQQCS